jgi:CheY-like chemotaxis protein
MPRPLNILLIEDDAIEVMKFNRVVSSQSLSHKVTEANNGEEALAILNGKQVVPDLIVLDLNMPKINDDVLKYIPAVMLTTSNNYKDVMECYRLGIAGYMLKPLKYEDYVDRIQKMLDYWSYNEVISY